MKTNISAELTDRRKNYQATYFSMGKNITDADLNAAVDDLRYGQEDLVEQYIAPYGSPDMGFRIRDARVSNGAIEFDLQQGHFTLGGITLEAKEGLRYQDQSDYLTQSLHGLFEAPNVRDLTASSRFDFVYLEMIKTPVRAVEDAELREPALPTYTHSRMRPQLRIHAGRLEGENCQDAQQSLENLFESEGGFFSQNSAKLQSPGRLQVNFQEGTNGRDPCTVDIARGHTLHENHTIKVISRANGRFNWAFDNGEDLHRVSIRHNSENGVSHAYLCFTSPLHDPHNLPRINQIVELCPYAALLPNHEKTAELTGFRARFISNFNITTQEIEISAPLDEDLNRWWEQIAPGILAATPGVENFIYARIWEAASDKLSLDDAMGANVALGDTGLHLNFINNGVEGDYWTFSARPAMPTHVIPWRFHDPEGAPPTGADRYYALLGIIEWQLDADRQITGKVRDCARRFRPLWRSRCCCRYNVGDGIHSFGDYNNLQAAIDDLPEEGGEICLLPGIHAGGITIADRNNITISGCGKFSRVRESQEDSVFHIEASNHITLHNFAIENGNAIAIGSEATNDLSITSLEVEGTGASFSILGSDNTKILDCTFLAEARDEIETSQDSLKLSSIGFIGGNNIEIRHCKFIAENEVEFSRQALGGLQIASNSRQVIIKDNFIAGGSGPGIRLGDIKRITSVNLAYARFAEILKWLHANLHSNRYTDRKKGHNRKSYEMQKGNEKETFISSKFTSAEVMKRDDKQGIVLESNAGPSVGNTRAGCAAILPIPKNPDKNDPNDDFTIEVNLGRIEHIYIENNTIMDMGCSGITNAAWFLSRSTIAGRFELRHGRIANNHISNVQQLNIGEAFEDDDLFEMGFGGIALDEVHDLVISDNKIFDIGQDVTVPCCAIFLRMASQLEIHNNDLSNIGRLEDRRNNVPGIWGGIVVDDILDETNDEVGEQTRAGLSIHNNQVEVNFGIAIDVRGNSGMSVIANRAMTRGWRYYLQRPRIGQALSVVNNQSPLIELYYLVSLMVLYFLRLYKFDYDVYSNETRLPLRTEPLGQSLVVHDNLVSNTFSSEIPASLASIAFTASSFDVSFQSNTVKSRAGKITFLSGLGLFSMISMRCLNNLVMNDSGSVPFGIVSIASANTTGFNQSSHQNFLSGFLFRSGFETNIEYY